MVSDTTSAEGNSRGRSEMIDRWAPLRGPTRRRRIALASDRLDLPARLGDATGGVTRHCHPGRAAGGRARLRWAGDEAAAEWSLGRGGADLGVEASGAGG